MSIRTTSVLHSCIIKATTITSQITKSNDKPYSSAGRMSVQNPETDTEVLHQCIFSDLGGQREAKEKWEMK